MNKILFDHVSNEIVNLINCDSLFKYINVCRKKIYGWQRRQTEIRITITLKNKNQQLGEKTVKIFTAAECSDVCSEDPRAQDGAVMKHLAEIQRRRLQGLTRCATKLIIACIDRAVCCITVSCSQECWTLFHFWMAYSSGTPHCTTVRTNSTAPRLALQSRYDNKVKCQLYATM